MRNLDDKMTFYADKSAYKYPMCENGCPYVADTEGLCKRCAALIDSLDGNLRA